MKTTIKLGRLRSLSVQPDGRGVRFELLLAGVLAHMTTLTADQAMALGVCLAMEDAFDLMWPMDRGISGSYNGHEWALTLRAGGMLHYAALSMDQAEVLTFGIETAVEISQARRTVEA